MNLQAVYIVKEFFFIYDNNKVSTGYYSAGNID